MQLIDYALGWKNNHMVCIDDKWWIARPLKWTKEYTTFIDRLMDAWQVLKGKAEAFYYYKQ